MGEHTHIQWCDATWNPWKGCEKVSAGCAHCYAETMSKRNPAALGIWGKLGTRVVAVEKTLNAPIGWDRKAKFDGVRRRVFCASLADVFEDWRGQVTNHKRQPMWCLNQGEWFSATSNGFSGNSQLTLDHLRERMFATILACPNLDFLLLTKRPENVVRMATKALGWDVERHGLPPNIWMLTSVEDQATANERIPHLLQIKASVLGISGEPLLGPVDLEQIPCPIELDREGAQYYNALAGRSYWSDGEYGVAGPSLNWVIVGGESGHSARPMHPQWARKIRDDCQAAGVPFFFKQWGEWRPDGQGMPYLRDVIGGRGAHDIRSLDDEGLVLARRIGKKAAGRLLDGVEWNQMPEPKGVTLA